MILTALLFLVILSVLVLIHELGHFLVAKRLGVKVEEFGFGLPPRLFGKKIGETIYSMNWLPIGGFVKLYGEDEAGAGKLRVESGPPAGEAGELKVQNKKRAFFARPVGQRAAIVLAGVVMNMFLAVVIYYAFLGISNFRTEIALIGQHRFFLVNQIDTADIIVSAVSKGSPAEQAGITPLVKIVSVNGKRVADTTAFLEVIKRSQGKTVSITWEELRTGKRSDAGLTPRTDPPKNEGPLGIAFFSTSTANLYYETPLQKAFSGVIHPLNLTMYNLKVLGMLVSVSLRQKTVQPLSEGVSGPVGIYSLVGNIVQISNLRERVLQTLNLAGVLSISLAFFNVLPIPALDGGRLFFILIEAVTKRRVNQKFESYAHAVGMAILLTLILLITMQDIAKIFRLPHN